VFGQGAIRCHPYVLREMEAIAANDLAAFDEAIFGHFNHVARNMLRAFALALTGGRLADTPFQGAAAAHAGQLECLSAALAFAADLAMLSFGGSLKRREYVSGRLADLLAWLYIASGVLKSYHDEGN